MPNSCAEVADAFAQLAEQFCHIVDFAGRMDRTDLLIQVYRALPGLIEEAVNLPETELSHAGRQLERSESPGPRKGSDGWKTLYQALTEKLADWDLYWEVFDPIKDTTAIRGSLADDLADICGDLRKGLELKSRNAPPQDVIWHWRFSFHSHWGKHAIDALHALHWRLEDVLS